MIASSLGHSTHRDGPAPPPKQERTTPRAPQTTPRATPSRGSFFHATPSSSRWAAGAQRSRRHFSASSQVPSDRHPEIPHPPGTHPLKCAAINFCRSKPWGNFFFDPYRGPPYRPRQPGDVGLHSPATGKVAPTGLARTARCWRTLARLDASTTAKEHNLHWD